MAKKISRRSAAALRDAITCALDWPEAHSDVPTIYMVAQNLWPMENPRAFSQHMAYVRTACRMLRSRTEAEADQAIRQHSEWS